MGPIDAVPLVEVDLSGHRLPPDPSGLVGLQEKHAVQGNATGKFERCGIQHE